MKRKFLIVFFASLLLFSLSACSVDASGYYDDDALMLAHIGNYATLGSVVNNTSEKSTLTANQWDGAKKIKKLSVSENPTLEVSMKLGGGRMKLVAVGENDAVFLVAEVTAENSELASPVETALASGSYLFVLVADLAEEAEFTFVFPV